MQWLTEKESEALEDAVMKDAQEWADATALTYNAGQHYDQTGGVNPWVSLLKRKLVFSKEMVKSTCGSITMSVYRPTPIALLLRAALKNLNSQSTNGTSI